MERNLATEKANHGHPPGPNHGCHDSVKRPINNAAARLRLDVSEEERFRRHKSDQGDNCANQRG
jgi:hypothetical protein